MRGCSATRRTRRRATRRKRWTPGSAGWPRWSCGQPVDDLACAIPARSDSRACFALFHQRRQGTRTGSGRSHVAASGVTVEPRRITARLATRLAPRQRRRSLLLLFFRKAGLAWRSAKLTRTPQYNAGNTARTSSTPPWEAPLPPWRRPAKPQRLGDDRVHRHLVFGKPVAQIRLRFDLYPELAHQLASQPAQCGGCRVGRRMEGRGVGELCEDRLTDREVVRPCPAGARRLRAAGKTPPDRSERDSRRAAGSAARRARGRRRTAHPDRVCAAACG